VTENKRHVAAALELYMEISTTKNYKELYMENFHNQKLHGSLLENGNF
jgi:hypothetical protein